MANPKYYEGQEFDNPDDPSAPVLVYRAGKFFPKGMDIPASPTGKPTEDQAKALTYGKLMANAEKSYGDAVAQGYDPGGIRNTAASIAEGLPFGGLDGLGTLLRDDVSDRARQAELQWSDAQLKALSGAASPEAEVKRGVKTFFGRPGENFRTIGPQKAGARDVAFTAVRTRAGPLSSQVGLYPNEPGYSPDKAIDLSDGRSRSTIPIGAFYRDKQGNIRENKNGDRGNPIVRPAAGSRPADKYKRPAAGTVKELTFDPKTGELR
jgi:hypothetical protein